MQQKCPVTQRDDKVHENILPWKTINDYKTIQSIQTEKQAAIYNIDDNVESTLHFDQRSKIDGDWPCLILIFSDNSRFSLRSLFFAYEDRENIARLIFETYTRLALLVTSPKKLL